MGARCDLLGVYDMSKQAATASAPAAAPAAAAPDDATLALAVRALAIATAPAAPPAPTATEALANAVAALHAAGGKIPPQAAATLAMLGGAFSNAATNRPAPALILTGPKAYAAAETAYRVTRATGAAAYLPSQYVAINPVSAHRKVVGTGGWFRTEVVRLLPSVAAYTKALGGKGATEMTYNLKNGFFMLSDAPLPAARHPYLESLTDADIALMPPNVAYWAVIARNVALAVRDEQVAAAASKGGV